MCGFVAVFVEVKGKASSLDIAPLTILNSPVRAPGCKNGPAPFPGRMSYKATKPGLVFVLYLSMFVMLVFIRAPFMYC